MPYLQLNDTQFPLLEGDTRVGRGDSADLKLPRGDAAAGVYAVITLAPDFTATVRRESPTTSIFINRVPLGQNPMPLMHGDRLTIDGVIGLYGDETQSGLTAQMSIRGNEVDSLVLSGAPTANTAGRLISHTDGREYIVGPDGVTIGREAGCDIVIAAGEVSRRHARIELHPAGYAIVDLSTNGLLVNGTRVASSRPLSNGDTIRIGPEEFRFHGELAPKPQIPPTPKATPPSVARPDTSPTAPRPAESPSLPAAAASVPSPAIHTATAAQAPSASAAPPTPQPAVERTKRNALASLEIINEGPSKGTRFTIDSPLTHIGRGAHNDVVISDESVSDSHAKIQRRDEGWVVVDMDSTNGTYVSGQRVIGEEPLGPNTDIRFGGVKLAFRTLAAARDESGGTRVIVGYKGAEGKARMKTPSPSRAIDESPAPEPEAPAQGGTPRLLVGAVLILALVVVYFIVRTLWK